MTKPDDLVDPPESYAAAAAEVDAILDEIERGDADLDTLSNQVERAAALIRWCRDRLAGTELQVTKALDALEPPADDD